MNHETKEQAARRYINCQEYPPDGAIPDGHEFEPHQHMIDTFIAGASWRERQAASGLQEWWESVAKEVYRTKPTLDVEKTWQAAQLSSAKLLAEKDAEIDELKKTNEELRSHWKRCREFLSSAHDDRQKYHRIIEKIKALLGEE